MMQEAIRKLREQQSKVRERSPQWMVAQQLMDLVRAELLEEGEVTEDVAALVILLEQGKCLKPYFSAFEQKEMRDKLQAISQTPAGKAVRDMVEYVENLIAVMTLLVTVFT